MKVLTMFTLAVATACAWKQPPVVTVGSFTDVSTLAGEWSGEYRSNEAQHSGTIWFRLDAGRDTALGDVLMRPRESVALPAPSAPGVWQAAPRVSTIKFVRVQWPHLTGAIEPYTSPDCDCLLVTVFRGEVKGDRIEGDFSIIHTAHGTLPQSGTWWATRTRQPAR